MAAGAGTSRTRVAAHARRLRRLGYSGEQRHIAGQIVSIGERQHRHPRKILAALETGLVESNLRNLGYGDGTSIGWRQETASSYPNVNRRNVAGGIKRFYSEARGVSARGKSAGQIAQAVQRSAFPARYDQRKGDAQRIYRALHGQGGTTGGDGGSRVVGGRPASSTRSAQGVGGTALAELTAKALQRQQGPPSFTLPAAPAHTAHVTLPEGQVAGPPQSGLVTPQQSEPSLQELLAAASADARVQDARSTVNPAVAGQRVGGGGPSGGGGLGKVRVNPGADRAGVKTRPATLKFARKVAGVYGHPLTVGTGTNHSQMTTTGSVSEHWSGHAVDIPLAGKALTRAGHAALIAAGMPRAQARRAKGGIYNVGNHQIIFNTTDGGNHWNHLHISTH